MHLPGKVRHGGVTARDKCLFSQAVFRRGPLPGFGNRNTHVPAVSQGGRVEPVTMTPVVDLPAIARTTGQQPGDSHIDQY